MDHAARLKKTSQTVTKRLGSGNEVTIIRPTLGDIDPATGKRDTTGQSLGDRVPAVLEGPEDNPTGAESTGAKHRVREYRVARADLSQEPRPTDILTHHGAGPDGGDITLKIAHSVTRDHDAMCIITCVENTK